MTTQTIIDNSSKKSRIIVCKECIDYKCPNGMDMICALWNEEVSPDHSCEWGKRREDGE